MARTTNTMNNNHSYTYPKPSTSKMMEANNHPNHLRPPLRQQIHWYWSNTWKTAAVWLARHLGTHVFALFQNSSSHDPRWSLCIPQNVPHRAACAGPSSAHCLKGVWHTPLLIATAAAMSPNGLLLSHDKDIPYWPYWWHIQTHLLLQRCWLQNHLNIPSLKDLQGSFQWGMTHTCSVHKSLHPSHCIMSKASNHLRSRFTKRNNRLLTLLPGLCKGPRRAWCSPLESQ